MSGSPSSRLAIIGLSASLAAALLVIAFLLGRESAQAPVAPEAGVPAPPALESDIDARVGETEERRWPKWADLDPWEGVEESPERANEASAGRIVHQEDGRVVLSNRQSEATRPATPGKLPSDQGTLALSAYFLKMDTIRAESGAGDPNTFAMDLVKGVMNGSTAGFDELIADARRMENEARQVTPPPSCERYHQANLEALAESREVLEAMRKAIVTKNVNQLMSIAQRAGALQHEAEALEQMRKQIYTDARR
jgi:hypothetical protein